MKVDLNLLITMADMDLSLLVRNQACQSIQSTRSETKDTTRQIDYKAGSIISVDLTNIIDVDNYFQIDASIQYAISAEVQSISPMSFATVDASTWLISLDETSPVGKTRATIHITDTLNNM